MIQERWDITGKYIKRRQRIMFTQLMALQKKLRTSLQFQPDLEESFMAELLQKNLSFIRVALWVEIILYASFGILDIWIVPETKFIVWTIRFGIVIPFTLLVFLFSYTKAFRFYWQFVISVNALVAGFGIIGIIAVSKPTELGFQLYYAGLMLIIMGIYLWFRLRYIYATVASLIVVLGYEVVAIGFQGALFGGQSHIGVPVFVSNNFFLLSSIVICNIGGLTIELYMREAFLQRIATEEQRERAENLLLSILPAPIAKRLETSPDVIADRFDNVSILFADIVNFTPLCAHVSCQEVVNGLNEVFSRFDELSERHGLEKIKTIGDAYMVTAGVPLPRQDHAEAIAEMALDMQKTARSICLFSLDRPILLRIGINSGEVVAGVIGRKKFIYDLWGDTVNVASRMESQGVPGRIQVSENTYQLLKHMYDFECRGEIDVKGKGIMQTYFLTDFLKV